MSATTVQPAGVATTSLDLDLGTPANLLFGVGPVWTGTSASLFAPQVASTKTFPSQIDAVAASWGWPTLTLHPDAASLLSTLYDYRVLPATMDPGTFSVPAGPLAVSDSDSADALAAAGKFLGVDLTKGWSYMLVRLRRSVGSTVHPSIESFGELNRDDYLTDEAREAMTELPTGPGEPDLLELDLTLTAAEAQQYVEALYRFGTHFVSSVEAGDVIFQVFAYAPDRFASLQHAFDQDKDANGQVTGLTALEYQYYTTPASDQLGKYGFTSAAGTIGALSGDPQVASTVAQGDWNDKRYLQGPSIFEAFAAGHLHFLDQFSAIAPIRIDLTPMSDLAPGAFQAKVLARLFKGALLQKYGSAVTVPFSSLSPYQWSTLLPAVDSSWLSTIATPTVDVYQEMVDLAAIQLANTAVVKMFTVVSLGVVASGNAAITLPGGDVVIASYVLDTSTNATVPVVQVDPSAFDGMKIVLGEMYGALRIATSDGSRHDVLLDGFRFADGAVDSTTKRVTVDLVDRVDEAPDAGTLARITTDLQFSMASAESLLWSRGAQAEAARKLAVGYLEWISGMVPHDTQDEDLAAIRAQAQYLAKAALNLAGHGAQVPYLTFDAYKDYVASMVTVADALSDQVRDYQTQIAERKQAELTAKTAEQINDNIKKTGDLLTKYFGVLAQNQEDMAAYYGSIADQKRQEYSKTVTDIGKLEASLKEQQKAVNQSVEDFQKAVRDWETEAILKLCLTVATDVFTLAASIAIPSGELAAVQSLGETAQKIQKVMNVLGALAKLEGDLETTIRSLNGAAQALQQLKQPLDMPSSLEWQEFVINMNASLAQVPGEIATQKANLQAAFQILALRGQALLNARAKQAQILTDIYFNEKQQAINKTQADRLDQLRSALNLGDTSPPDVSQIDLIGLTGQVQSQLKQVLAALAKTLAIQDAAVQYAYLGQPATIQKFDLTSLKTVMMQQQANIINALNLLNPPPQPVDAPIEYRVAGVPASLLTNGSLFDFTIQPSATEFWKYAMVRVDKVVARVEGIEGSTGGQYLAALSFTGDPFEDRDAQRNPVEFNTVQRNFGPYVYDIATGKPQFGDQTGTIASNITNITPFGSWHLSLPATSTNAGITFKEPTVDIVLTFDITALYVDPARVAPARAMAAKVAAGDGAPGTTLADMLTNMYTNQAVLKGWDVVFNVLEDPVNNFMAQQYKEKYAGQDMPINLQFCTGPVPDPMTGGYIGVYNKFTIDLGGPLLQFMQNNHSFVTVKQMIKSGSQQTGGAEVDENWDPSKDCNFNDPNIKWGPVKPVKIDPNNPPYIQGAVALAQVQGLVAPKNPGSTTQSVVLDFAQGSFVAKSFSVNTDNATLNTQLTNWFVTNPISYIVNTVDYSNIALLPALTPTKFLLNVLTTNSGKNILQQFITTTGTQRSDLTINVNEPIPDTYDCSLMINTKIMFENIFVQAFNQGSTNIKVAAIDPGQDFKAWCAQITSGSVTGNVNFPSDNRRIQYRIDSNGNTVNWDITGLKFQRTEQLAINLNYTATKTQGFQVRTYACAPRGGCWWSDWSDHSVDVNVVMTGNYPITIQNSGQFAGKNQTIQLASSPPDVDVSNTSLKPTGPCECNDHDLQIAVKDELAKDVPGAVQTQMASIKFQAISIFALENLLFPGGSLITMKGAYVPGDLVVVGNLADGS